MAKNRKIPKKHIEVAIIVLISLISIFIWNSVVIYPIKLFVVLLHELSHGLAAILSGGKILDIQITSQLGGHCVVQGGNGILITSAGYLGSLFWGALLFISGYFRDFNKWFSLFIGAVLIIVTANYFPDSWVALITVGFAIFFLLAPFYVPPVFHSYITKTLGFISCLYVIVDISQDTILNTFVGSDAEALAAVTNIPSVVWGVLWVIISIMSIYYLLKLSFKRGITTK